jgi:hypothetical protein
MPPERIAMYRGCGGGGDKSKESGGGPKRKSAEGIFVNGFRRRENRFRRPVQENPYGKIHKDFPV